MSDVILFGIGQLADVAHFYLTHDSPHKLIGFTVDSAYVDEDQHLKLPVVAFEEVEKHYPPSRVKMFLPLGYKQVNKLRTEKYSEAKAKGYELISYISSKATTWPGLVIGDNCFIFEHNVIQPYVTIGNNVIMWSGNHIGHHTVIKDHCFISSHVVVSGNVTVGESCFLGVNATIRDNITIARECVIGSGALILKGTKEREVYLGNNATRLGITSDQLPNI